MKTIRVVAAVICDSMQDKTQNLRYCPRLWRLQRPVGVSGRQNRAGRNPAAGSEAGNRRRTGHGNRRGESSWDNRV